MLPLVYIAIALPTVWIVKIYYIINTVTLKYLVKLSTAYNLDFVTVGCYLTILASMNGIST